MQSLCLLLAPPGPAAGVLDVLQDLSGLGLVSPFVWVEATKVRAYDVPALRVDGGTRSATTLQQLLLTEQYRRVRLCVIVPVLAGAAGVPPAVEAAVDELLGTSGGGAVVERIRAVLLRPDAGPGEGDLAREGWHNVVLSPYESAGPGLTKRLLRTSDDPLEIGRHAAPALASLTGLWHGQPTAPLDGAQVLPGRWLRHARAFYRRLDADAVEHELRSRVCDLSRGMPRARDQSGTVVHVEDVELATRSMAEALWRKHAAVLQGSRMQVRGTGASSIGVREALRMLFGFLGAAVRNAPAAWYAGVMNRASSAVASSVHGAVFGAAPSAYQVVVKGVTPSGVPASWQETAVAARQLDEVLRDPGERREHHQAPVSLGALWHDYCSSALTLCDGGLRDPALPPVQVGSQVGVLRDAGDCVPGDDEAFEELPPLLAATIGEQRIQAVDVLGWYGLGARLEQLAQQDSTALEAERGKQALLAWRQQRADSYGVQVGDALGRAMVDVREEVRRLLLTIQDLAQVVTPDDSVMAEQRRLVRVMQFLLALLALGLVVPAVLLGLDVIAWTTALLIAVGALLVWGVGTVAVFVQRQRRLFQVLHRRQESQSQMTAMRHNLRQALVDQRRLADAYGQFLTWSALLGEFLRRPFGSEPDGARSTGRGVVLGLPANVGLGTAVPDDAAITEAATLARRDVFTVGWLSSPFETLLAEAPQRIGPEAQDLREDADAIYRQPAGTTDSLLDAWAADVLRDGVGGTSRGVVWGRTLELLDAEAGGLRRRLITEVVPSGSSRPVPQQQFGAGVDDPTRAAETFDGALLSREAQGGAGTGAAEPWTEAVRQGLGHVAVRVDVGTGVAPWAFAVSHVGPDDGDHDGSHGGDDEGGRPAWVQF